MTGTEVSIEPTNYCNAKCVFCPAPTSKRDKGDITIPTLITIIKSLKDVEMSGINPVGLGEPLMNPEIFMIISILKSYYPAVPIRLATNGIALDEKNIRGLIKVLDENDSVLISLNFSNPKEYKEMMGINRYNQVKNNILRLLELQPIFKVKVQYLLTNKNFWRLPVFALYWKPKVDVLFVRPMEDWGGRVLTKHLFLFNPPESDNPQIVFTWDGKRKNTCLELADADAD